MHCLQWYTVFSDALFMVMHYILFSDRLMVFLLLPAVLLKSRHHLLTHIYEMSFMNSIVCQLSVITENTTNENTYKEYDWITLTKIDSSDIRTIFDACTNNDCLIWIDACSVTTTLRLHTMTCLCYCARKSSLSGQLWSTMTVKWTWSQSMIAAYSYPIAYPCGHIWQ